MEKIRLYWLLIIGIALILLAGLFLILLRGDEDTWIKDKNGIWIMHGNPSLIPEYVKTQQDAIACANQLYNNAKNNKTVFNSQCLGRCSTYSVDIVNVPRNSEDNKPENQCSDFQNKITTNFIELDKNGNIVRIFEKE